jgi:hypothetical protein
MSASWMTVPMSEKLHAVYKGDWHDSIVSKAMRVATAPVPFLSEWDEALGYGAFPEGNLGDDGMSEGMDPTGLCSDLPADIAEMLFGTRSA